MKCPVELTSAHVIYDRSRTVTDWYCPRKRYHNYERDGTGVVPDDEAVELFTGSVNHNALSAIATQQLEVEAGVRESIDIDTIACRAHKEIFEYHCDESMKAVEKLYIYANEQASLTEGLLRGFVKHSWPQLMEVYEIVAIEEEMFFVHDQHGKSDVKHGKFVMMVKPDLVLKHRETGEYVYLEYKTTSSKREGWINSWDDAVQLHSTINAIDQSLGTRPTSVIVQGLYKGYESYGKQSSPFCYAYHRQGYPPFSTAEYSYEYRNGLRRVPTWEMEGGTKAWVAGMPSNVLADQFPRTPPIFCNDDLITAYFMQQAMRELEVKMAKQMIAEGATEQVILNGAFPQRFDKCKPPYGNPPKPCAYRLLCHGSCKDPLKSGYTKRQPHHEAEIAAQEV